MEFPAFWTCVTLISNDISKLRVKLIQQQADGTWQEITNPAYSPVLWNPNHYQTDHQFWETWIQSKLLHGNTYALKRRDQRNVVTALYILDPSRVAPLVSDDGSVFYDLNTDGLSGVPERLVVPAREMIHDRWNCLFNPLVGHSPIFAAALSASQGLRIQRNSEAFFKNRASPSFLLTAPAHIEPSTAEYLSSVFNENYGGENSGNVAVVGDNLKAQQLTMTAVDAQLIEQLRLTSEMICNVFHVPSYKAGIGPMPTQTGIEALNIEYYSQALQKLIEDAEGCLDRGLGLSNDLGVEFDQDGLFRMDTLTKIQSLRQATEASIMSPNEARAKLDLGPVPGGDQPYMQQQYWPVGVLANRAPPTPPVVNNPQAPAESGPPTTATTMNSIDRKYLPRYASAIAREVLFDDETMQALLVRTALRDESSDSDQVRKST